MFFHLTFFYFASVYIKRIQNLKRRQVILWYRATHHVRHGKWEGGELRKSENKGYVRYWQSKASKRNENHEASLKYPWTTATRCLSFLLGSTLALFFFSCFFVYFFYSILWVFLAVVTSERHFRFPQPVRLTTTHFNLHRRHFPISRLFLLVSVALTEYYETPVDLWKYIAQQKYNSLNCFG